MESNEEYVKVVHQTAVATEDEMLAEKCQSHAFEN